MLSHWGSWVSAFRSGPLAWAEDLVNDIIRDGPGAGVTAIVSGGRELVAARFFAALPNRIFFPAGSTEESRHGWPRLPEVPALPGRVAAAGAFAGATAHAAQLCEPPEAGTRPCPSGPLTVRPFRVEPLPAVVTVSEVRARTGPELPARPAPGWLWVGLGGDEPGPAGLPLPPGTVLAVLGGPGAGKTSLLRALPGLNPAVEWLRPGPGARPEDYWSAVLARARAGQLDRGAIALADDLDLAGMDTNMQLVELNGLGWTVVLTAGYRPLLQQRVPLALQVRGQGCGIMIAPRAAADADLFGIRFEPEHSPPPGRAVACGQRSARGGAVGDRGAAGATRFRGPESLEGAA